MPIYLEPRDVTSELEKFRSVLIVSCLMCPPISLAKQKKQPLIDVSKHGFKMKAYDDYVTSIREPLEKRGIRTDVYGRFLRPFPPRIPLRRYRESWALLAPCMAGLI